ncbi:MAG: M50 family metallopeptidase, partial [Gemmatimonadetes bacterium]|nr:M50 family metallopeptidase [Gemmatimonadota bacterium]MYG35930.1 M50 family metallopeptidase [Gemmatimonadota bacterium]
MPTPKRNSTVGPRTRTAATLLLAVGLGVGLALGVNALFGDPDPGPAANEGRAASSIVALVAFMVVAGFLALAVHEVGHAIGGRLRGMRLGMLIVGPVHIQREPDGRLGWRLNRKLLLAGGVVSSVPRSTRGLRRAMLSFIAGGPVTSIVMGVLVFAIYARADLADTFAAQGPVQDALAAGVLFLGVVSVGIGFVTLLPINQGAFVNDGKRILKLLRPGAYADAYAAVMALGAYALAQVPPRDRDPDLVGQAASLADGSHEDLAGRLAAHSDALHREDVEVAREHMRYLLDHRDAAYPPYRPVIDLAAAYFEAAHAGDAESARSRLEGAGESALLAFDPTVRTRTEGAVLLAEGDKEGASGKFREAYAALESEWNWGNEYTMAEIRRLCLE